MAVVLIVIAIVAINNYNSYVSEIERNKTAQMELEEKLSSNEPLTGCVFIVDEKRNVIVGDYLKNGPHKEEVKLAMQIFHHTENVNNTGASILVCNDRVELVDKVSTGNEVSITVYFETHEPPYNFPMDSSDESEYDCEYSGIVQKNINNYTGYYGSEIWRYPNNEFISPSDVGRISSQIQVFQYIKNGKLVEVETDIISHDLTKLIY